MVVAHARFLEKPREHKNAQTYWDIALKGTPRPKPGEGANLSDIIYSTMNATVGSRVRNILRSSKSNPEKIAELQKLVFSSLTVRNFFHTSRLSEVDKERVFRYVVGLIAKRSGLSYPFGRQTITQAPKIEPSSKPSIPEKTDPSLRPPPVPRAVIEQRKLKEFSQIPLKKYSVVFADGKKKSMEFVAQHTDKNGKAYFEYESLDKRFNVRIGPENIITPDVFEDLDYKHYRAALLSAQPEDFVRPSKGSSISSIPGTRVEKEVFGRHKWVKGRKEGVEDWVKERGILQRKAVGISPEQLIELNSIYVRYLDLAISRGKITFAERERRLKDLQEQARIWGYARIQPIIKKFVDKADALEKVPPLTPTARGTPEGRWPEARIIRRKVEAEPAKPIHPVREKTEIGRTTETRFRTPEGIPYTGAVAREKAMELHLLNFQQVQVFYFYKLYFFFCI